MKRVVAPSQSTFRWLNLAVLLFMGGLLCFGSSFARADGKLSTVPTKLKPLKKVEVKALPVKTVVAQPLPPAPKEERCILVKEEAVTYAPAQVTALSDLLVRSYCSGVEVVVPGVYSYLQPPPTVTWTYRTVCQ